MTKPGVSPTDITAILGVVFGLSGLILGILNYLRDRARIIVTLQWDMKILNDPRHDENKYWGIVTATNIGRRPIYISHAALILPKGYDSEYLLLAEGIKRTKGVRSRPTCKLYCYSRGNEEIRRKLEKDTSPNK